MSDQFGFYYLHTEGALIFKSSVSHSESDLIESPFVRCYWPFNPGKRADAWHIIIEGAVAGVNAERLRVLAELWGCNETDADNFAKYIGVQLHKTESHEIPWLAVPISGKVRAHGTTKIMALSMLCRALGWKSSKDRVSFEELVKGER